MFAFELTPIFTETAQAQPSVTEEEAYAIGDRSSPCQLLSPSKRDWIRRGTPFSPLRRETFASVCGQRRPAAHDTTDATKVQYRCVIC
jgi:hypothetical protein